MPGLPLESSLAHASRGHSAAEMRLHWEASLGVMFISALSPEDVFWSQTSTLEARFASSGEMVASPLR